MLSYDEWVQSTGPTDTATFPETARRPAFRVVVVPGAQTLDVDGDSRWVRRLGILGDFNAHGAVFAYDSENRTARLWVSGYPCPEWVTELIHV